jgi:transcriptional regulator
MYIPNYFQGPGQPAVFDFVEAHSFGLIVSASNGELCGTHLPILLRRDVGPHGQLVGHMAHANPHWRQMAGAEVLAIFNGPHAYISPSWYEADDVVPTWNYLAVHATGRCELIDDDEAAMQVVADYVAFYEQSMPRPWRLDTTTTYNQRLVKQIVAFRIDIARLEAKWKLGQNHSADRREKVSRHLAEGTSADAQEIGRLMRGTLGT